MTPSPRAGPVAKEQPCRQGQGQGQEGPDRGSCRGSCKQGACTSLTTYCLRLLCPSAVSKLATRTLHTNSLF